MEIEIQPDRETARERAEAVQSTAGIVVYSDASGDQYCRVLSILLRIASEIPWPSAVTSREMQET